MSLDIGKVAIALLGLLAYKNRDRIGELIAGRNSTDAKNAGSTGGLGDILERLRNAGAGDQVDSWVGTGSNRPVQRDQVEKAIDPQTLNDLAEQTGLSREELLDPAHKRTARRSGQAYPRRPDACEQSSKSPRRSAWS
ncbi:YidB family protein [Mesorhizobium sp.]|uniref:YidB family protein n=1 Tax=Mesorhizobium sp. TaxID=1871066 RepID=UPI0026AB48F7